MGATRRRATIGFVSKGFDSMTFPHFRLALPCLLALVAPAFADDRPAPPSITVVGEAHEDVRPDIAIITFSVIDDRAGSVEAANENARIVGVVIDGLKGSGVEVKDIATVGASLYPVFSEQRDPKTNAVLKSVVTGYRARNELRVHVREIERAGAIIGTTVQNGALYEGVSFDLSDRDARLDGLRGKAAANAARRAALYAEGLSVKLGPVRALNAAEGSASYEPVKGVRALAAMAPGAPAPLQIEPGTVSLRDSITATFDLITP